MHVINIHATYMSSVNSMYHHITLQSLHLYWLSYIEYTQRSQDCYPTLHQYNGRNLCLGTEKFNKWLKKPYLNISPPRGYQSSDWDYTSLILVIELQEKPPSGSVVSSKNINKKTWVQSRTQQDLRRNYTTHAHVSMKREVGFIAKVPALTWLVL